MSLRSIPWLIKHDIFCLLGVKDILNVANTKLLIPENSFRINIVDTRIYFWANYYAKNPYGYLKYQVQSNNSEENIQNQILWKAAEWGNNQAIIQAVNRGADLQSGWNSACRLAVQYGHNKTVELLLNPSQYGLDIDGIDVHARFGIYRARNSAFHCAAKYDQLETMKFLLNYPKFGIKASGENLESEYSDALPVASKNGSFDMVYFLLKSGVDPQVFLHSFIMAAGHGHMEIVKLLLETDNLDLGYPPIDVSQYFCKTSLIMASLNGYLEIIQFLSDHGVNLKSGLFPAAENGHIHIVQYILSRQQFNYQELFFVLGQAVKYGHYDVAKLLLEFKTHHNDSELIDRILYYTIKGGNVEFKTHHNDSELIDRIFYYTIKGGNVEFLKSLINSGINHNNFNYTYKVLGVAIQYDQFGMVRFFLQSEVGIYFKINRLDINRGLIMASQYGYCQIVKLLLDHKADIESRNYEKRTILDLAAERGHYETVRLLISQGADIHTTDKDGPESTLRHAAIEGHVEIVKLLLTRGALPYFNLVQTLSIVVKNGYKTIAEILIDTINNRTRMIHYLGPNQPYGRNSIYNSIRNRHSHIKLRFEFKNCDIQKAKNMALIEAAVYGHLKIVKMLLKAGADIHATDKPNKPDAVLWRAIQHNQIEMVKFVLSRGAVINNAIYGLSKAARWWKCDMLHLLLTNDDYKIIKKHPMYHDKLCKAVANSVKKNNLAVTEFLLNQGASLLDMEVAVWINNPPLVELLVQGTTIALPDNLLSLSIAESDGENKPRLKLINILLTQAQAQGINIDAHNGAALRATIKVNCLSTFKLLMERGAILPRGILRRAVEKQNTDIVQLLLNNQVKITNKVIRMANSLQNLKIRNMIQQHITADELN